MHLELLAQAAAFQGTEREHLVALADACSEVALAAGDLVFAHGDPAGHLYLVITGTVTLVRDQVGKPIQLLGRLGPGELLGELCLFDEERRSASARATTECRLLRLDRAAVQRLLAVDTRLALRIQNAAARRRSLNSAAALELGQQTEVRIRLHAPVRLRLADGRSLPVALENLSLGGLSLSSAPEAWGEGAAVRFELLADEEPLPVDGRVAWRRGDTVGIAFATHGTAQDLHVYRLLRKLGADG